MLINRICLAALLLLMGLLTTTASRADSASPPVTREQAKQLLETLQDPHKRAQFTSTLEAYVGTLPAGGAAPHEATKADAGAAPSDEAKRATPPDGVGKSHRPSSLKLAFSRIEEAAAHLGRDLRSVTDLPALSAWLGAKFDSPDEREAFSRGSVRIGLILAVTLGVEWLLRAIIRRRAGEAVARTGQAGAARLRQTLGRIAVRFGAILGAAAAGNAAVLSVADLPVARTIAFGMVNTYVALRFMLALLAEFLRTEDDVASGADQPRRLPAGSRTLLVAFLTTVALQLLSGDVADELGASDAIQDALDKCIALVAHALAIVLVFYSRQTVSGWIQRYSRPGTSWAAITEALAAIWPPVAVSAIAGSWLVRAMEVPDAYRQIIRLIFATLAVLLVSRFAGNLLLRSLDRKMTGYSAAPAGTLGFRLAGYRNAVRTILQVLLVVVTLLALTEAWGLPSLAWFEEGRPGHRFAEFALQLLLLGGIGTLCWEAADLAFERRVSSLMEASSLSRATRLRTLQPIIRLALLVVIALLVVMTALNAVGINVGPLLAGASIVGVALGLGSQKLVQDFITGIFLLVEDAVDVGDSVTVAGLSGTVEHISIRTIRLRAGDGSVHLIPFSAVTSVNNTNRGVGNAAVVVNVDPSEDTDRVSALLADVVREMRQEDAFASAMQSDLQLWGVDKVDGSMVTIAGQIVCTDTGRWGVQREFNRRVKIRFSREGVKLAVPHQSLTITRADPPVAGQQPA